MSKLDDLHTLIRLLKDFELPISPILEYSIQEKINQLSANDENPVSTPIIELQDEDCSINQNDRPLKSIKKELSTLRVVRADNSVIECEKAAWTFSQAIKEIGAERVYELKIPKDSMYLVTIGGNPKYPSAQYDIGNGFFVNTHSDTFTKKRFLERIFKALDLSWKAEIIEPD